MAHGAKAKAMGQRGVTLIEVLATSVLVAIFAVLMAKTAVPMIGTLKRGEQAAAFQMGMDEAVFFLSGDIRSATAVTPLASGYRFEQPDGDHADWQIDGGVLSRRKILSAGDPWVFGEGFQTLTATVNGKLVSVVLSGEFEGVSVSRTFELFMRN